jgi:beta-N-acetylhexosaminidase
VAMMSCTTYGLVMGHLLAALLSIIGIGQLPAEPLKAPQPRAMTLRQAAGQHMVFAYDGLVPPQDLRRRIARGEAAGVILFARNVGSTAQVRATMRSLQQIRRPRGFKAPLIVMADQEGGGVRRIPGAPVRAAADVDTVSQARSDGRAAARTLLRAGVNVNLAAVADVARPGAALEAERRTYGRTSYDVTRLASAFAAGLRAGRVLATPKHFPGFGAADVNTDAAPARIESSLDTLRAVDEPPFAALIADGVPAVMVSTAVYPALDEQPAALSPLWVRGELRRHLRFRGVAVSDDLGTPAVAPFGSNGRRAALAVQAGIDIPLFAGSYRAGVEAFHGIVAAARSGHLDLGVLRDKARRVLRMRARLAR